MHINTVIFNYMNRFRPFDVNMLNFTKFTTTKPCDISRGKPVMVEKLRVKKLVFPDFVLK